jgi:hypothetical protein
MALGVGGTSSYYSGAIAHVVATRFYQISLACAVVALLHFVSTWLYLGRPSRKFSSALLICLFILTFLGSNAIQPELARLNRSRFTPSQPAEQQASAARSYRFLGAVTEVFNILIIGGLVFYTWRLANPSDTLRFVTPVQFRG